MEPETAVGAFALTPLWLRLAILYLFAGLALSLYDARRTAGESILSAVVAVLVAAAIAPVTAITLLVGFFMKRSTSILPLCLVLVVLVAALAPAIDAGPFVWRSQSPCASGQCPGGVCPTERATGLLMPPLVKQESAPPVVKETPKEDAALPAVAETTQAKPAQNTATPFGFDITFEGKRGNKIIIGAAAEVVAAASAEHRQRLPRVKAVVGRARQVAARVVHRFRRH